MYPASYILYTFMVTSDEARSNPSTFYLKLSEHHQFNVWELSLLGQTASIAVYALCNFCVRLPKHELLHTPTENILEFGVILTCK